MTRRDIITAVPVAFAKDGALDMRGTSSILEYVAESGNEGSFVLGTTGEFPALSLSERAEIGKLSNSILGSKMRVVSHVGSASAYQSRELVRMSRDAGFREIAVLTPHYLKSTDSALIDYFEQIIDEARGMDIYIYVFQRVSNNFVSPELMAKLSKYPGVVGAKVSGEGLDLLDEYRAVVPNDFIIYTGSDRDMVVASSHGAQGVVSGVSSVLPKPFRNLAAAADSGDAAKQAEAQAIVDDVVDVIAGDMARMKVAYRLLGVTDSTVRMAIEQPDEATVAEIERVVRDYA